MSSEQRAQALQRGLTMRIGVGFGITVVTLSIGCGGASSKPGFEEGSSGGSSSSGGLGSSGGFDTGGTKPSADGCSDAAKLVYVVSQENELYSFTPNTTTFTKIGRLECPTIGTPNSMAIDREGTAWVNFSDGGLFKVSTSNASCTETSFEPNQGGFLKFGMAFATNGDGSSEETLYVSGLDFLAGGGQGLGKIDLKTMKLTMLGEYSGALAGEGAELTGTGDGRLFGFFTTEPHATLAQIDKSKGATSNDTSLDGVNTGNAWAFSFWGGDFWFYTSDGVSPSRVTQLKASGDKSISVAKSDVGGFRIVGAGVSTCAPTAPPK